MRGSYNRADIGSSRSGVCLCSAIIFSTAEIDRAIIIFGSVIINSFVAAFTSFHVGSACGKDSAKGQR